MLYYLLVLLATFLIDVVPFLAPPAWMVMVLLQIKFDLDIWVVLVVGVAGSTMGRYAMSLYIRSIAERFVSKEKTQDLEYLGKRLSQNSWKSTAFVFIYSLVPMPTTPLFQVAGIGRIPAKNILPGFFAGKFISDMVMLLAGKLAAENTAQIVTGLVSWETIVGALLGIILMALVLFTNWRVLLEEKRWKLDFRILK